MSEMKKTTKEPSANDKIISERVRMARLAAGISQEELGRRVGGLTFQQIQKYERGINRISAGRLIEIAKALGKPVSHFYRGLSA